MDQTEELILRIRERKPGRILLQLPEGLRMKAMEIVSRIEEEGVKVILSADPTYGACDLADYEAKKLHCDLLVHVGHNKFYADFPAEIPVIYFPWKIDIDTNGIDLSPLKEKRIGIVTTIQHLHDIGKVEDALERAGKAPVRGGQILGCWTKGADAIAGKVDAFLFVGSGNFHPLAIKGKSVYVMNVERRTVEKLDTLLAEKKRFANIYNARDAKSFGILVTSKPGQSALGKAEEIKKKLKEKDKKAYILIMDEITDARLLGLRVDAFINTACPRLMDDTFSKPMINADDVEMLWQATHPTG